MKISVGSIGLLVLMTLAGTSVAATLPVTNTNDAGAGSLRQAIIDANGTPALDTITFSIPVATDPNCVVATGVCTIAPTSALPSISNPVVIDGYTQTGATANTNPPNLGTNASLRIEVNLAGAGATGIFLTGTGSTIRGLIVNRSTSNAVVVQGTGGHTIEGNFIGTNAAGTAGFATPGNGIVVSAGSNNNIIGGTAAAARNLISGNATAILLSTSGAPIVGTTIQGNLIGTTSSGTVALPNDSSVFLSGAQNTLLGGTTAASRNVISGNTVGIIDSTEFFSGANGNMIQGNYIGVDVAGAALGNGQFGVSLPGRGTTLGGSAAGAGNVIAANGPQANVSISGRENIVQGNLIGTGPSGTVVPTGFVPGAFSVPGVSISGNLGTLNNAIGGTPAGAGNIIAFNTADGIVIDSVTGLGHSILGNSIFSNTRLGINLLGGSENAFGVTANDVGDADGGANGLQNYPVLTTASFAAGNVTISGTLNSIASATFRVEFFSSVGCDASGFGEGQTFLGFANVTTDATGNMSFGPLTFAVPAGQLIITSTATDAGGNTSEFSQAQPGACGATPTLSINNVSANEGDAGLTPFVFTVTLSAASMATVTVNYATSNGSATAGSDYVAASGVVTFAPGDLTKPVTVNVNGDTTAEPNETFFVTLSGPVNATLATAQGTGTIVNDDAAPPPTPTLSVNNVSANEGDAGLTPFVFTVTLSAASASTVTVNYATSDGSATAGSDYVATSGVLTFAPGDLTMPVTVNVNGDTVAEPNETFFLTLSAPVNATLANAQATGTIVNDDGGAVPLIPIPTLDEWALIAMGAILALLGAYGARARGSPLGRRRS
jgi:Calx-beta domain/IPTL-CTERM motif